VTEALSGFEGLLRLDADRATDAQLLRAHPADYIAMIRAAAPERGFRALDPDTYMSPGSLEAALRAAGGNCQAVDLVLSDTVKNAFVAMRPPGHHAEKTTAMGFCLFSSAAIGALHALEAHGLTRVAIVDFDVHHGNGTQDVLWEEPRVVFGSTHQMPLYPGTGAANETGVGNIFNAPLAPYSGGPEFRAAMERIILPAVDAHNPELIVISAGFDAHRLDPLASLNFEEEDFAWATEVICDLADTHCQGRVVSTLEGGYDLTALARSVAAHVKVLQERGA
jgi:acetoin utilization deacetylase AcuC-like enzyme